ncbi:McrC family protein [Spirosoma soli]|uniref:McrC family protein n=2 Tax=Spirosoma soli TaxID=1770529 RepID=A0ABW5MBE1_9BACT
MEQPFNLVENQTRTADFVARISLSDLDQYLDEVWQSRVQFDYSFYRDVSTKQPFLTFGQDLKTGKSTVKAGKYVGFIQYEGVTIQILPKLFQPEQAQLAFKHLIWWLSYCQRVRFPFSNLLGDVELVEEFPEALISYFAQTTSRLVGSLPYSQYEERTETLPFLRGRLNVQQYLNTSISQGNWHHLICDYEPFLYNNRLNQIIKYVARKLNSLCRTTETHRFLEKLIFTLDEVDDLPATVQDCDSLHLNRFYQEYEDCLAMCRFFLSDSYLTQPDIDQQQFCFLVPMDYVYEGFITGVCQSHLGSQFQKITPQATEWLTEEEIFKIRNDILLTYPDRSKIIVDTKYKIRNYLPSDKKTGVIQDDLYQMVSYALRQNTQEVLLLYPIAHDQQPALEQQFTVTSELMANKPIHIRAVDLTITGKTKQAILNQLLPQLTTALKLPADHEY